MNNTMPFNRSETGSDNFNFKFEENNNNNNQADNLPWGNNNNALNNTNLDFNFDK
jgi:hypothetical protein